MEVMERPKAKVADMNNDQLVKLYVQIRDQKAVEQKQWDTRKGELDRKLDKIAGILLQRYKELGIESAKTVYGTAYKHREYRANIADREIVREQLANGAWELVTLLPNKAGIKQHIEEHGDIPAGINWTEEITIRVNRA